VVVTCSFVATWQVFQATSDTWRRRPVLTTLVSMNRCLQVSFEILFSHFLLCSPVRELPFPTVVVCPNEEAPIDNMNYFTKILTAVAPDCKHFRSCQLNDFPISFLVETIFKDIVYFVAKEIKDKAKDIGMETAVSMAFDTEQYETFLNFYPESTASHLYYMLANNVTNYDEALELISTKAIRGMRYNELRDATDIIMLLKGNANYTTGGDKNMPKHRDDALLLVSLLTEITASESLENLGYIIEFFSAIIAPNQFKRDDNTYMNWQLDEGLLRGMPGKLHKVGAMFARQIFPQLTNSSWNPSLIDLPLMLGRRPTQREFLTSLREYMPFSIVTQEPNIDLRLKFHLLSSYCFKIMEQYLNSNTQGHPHPCNRSEACCFIKQKVKLFEQDSNLLMTMMSHSKHRASRVSDERDTLKTYMPDVMDFRNPTPVVDASAMIPFCLVDDGTITSRRTLKGHIKLVPCLSEFAPIVTNNGLCQAFNGINLLKNSSFVSSVIKSYEMNETHYNKKPDQLQKGLPKGQGLTFALDRGTALRGEWFDVWAVDKGGFDIAISSWHDSTSFSKRKIPLKIGYHTRITVKTSVIKANPSIGNLPPQSRKCYFPHENLDSVSLFNYYSQESCKMECMLNLAQDICGCTPWDYPYVENYYTSYSLCDSLGYFCYVTVMNNASHEENTCHCFPDCEVVTHQVTTSSEPIRVDKEC